MHDIIKQVLQENMNEELKRIIISNPRGGSAFDKIIVRPVMIKKNLCFQAHKHKGTQVFHENFTHEQIIKVCGSYLKEEFKQGIIETESMHIHLLVSKKGKVSIKKRFVEQKGQVHSELSHNRTKKYILEEGIPVPFLIDLGIQTQDGQVIKSKYDKFRQVNRYLELIQDILPTLMNKGQLNIIDFGCGKSYLTFAVYYYLHVLLGLPVNMTGLDLKEEVITHCNHLADKYGYYRLKFLHGDIARYQEQERVDMVISLHACDTATDYAIHKALGWGTSIIMAVPCCQHELNTQLDAKRCQSILKYGLIKERMSALITDAVRAGLLEEMGYDVQIIEFIDITHTPKNIMIRAVKNGKIKRKNNQSAAFESIKEVTDYLQVETTLQKLLDGGNNE